MKRFLLVLVIFTLIVSHTMAEHFNVDTEKVVYKEIDGNSLEMVIYRPQRPVNVNLPAIVFFFGGGWVGGNPDHFSSQAYYLATRGIIAICPDYRVKSRHNTTPFESVKDARSAMRYLKTHGNNLGIDTSKIVASGGSAGGHLAACTALIDEINEDTDDLAISPKPMALILFNPVVDTGKRGYGQEKLAGREFEISPVHHITEGVPPTLIMHGKNDKTVPYENVARFSQIMKQQGNKCTLVGYKNKGHGFFNYSSSPKHFKKTLGKTERFLEDLNLLKGTSWLKKYYKEITAANSSK